MFLRALLDDRLRTAAYGALAISERSLRACTQTAELYAENKKCAWLLRDLMEMGHVPAELAGSPSRPCSGGRVAMRCRRRCRLLPPLVHERRCSIGFLPSSPARRWLAAIDATSPSGVV